MRRESRLEGYQELTGDKLRLLGIDSLRFNLQRLTVLLINLGVPFLDHDVTDADVDVVIVSLQPEDLVLYRQLELQLATLQMRHFRHT